MSRITSCTKIRCLLMAVLAMKKLWRVIATLACFSAAQLYGQTEYIKPIDWSKYAKSSSPSATWPPPTSRRSRAS